MRIMGHGLRIRGDNFEAKIEVLIDRDYKGEARLVYTNGEKSNMSGVQQTDINVVMPCLMQCYRSESEIIIKTCLLIISYQ